VNPGGNSTIVQSTVVQSTVDLNMLMDIIETVFDRPTITTFVLMTGDKDFTRISARLKLRLNKTVIVVGIPGTVSRDLISSANQFVPLVPGGAGTPMNTGITGALPAIQPGSYPISSSTGTTGAMPAINYQGSSSQQFQLPYGTPPMDVLDPQFLQFLDYIDRNWSWRTIIGVSNFIGDPVNPKNRFRGRLTRESARELLNTCIQQGILLVQTDSTGAEDLRLNRAHPGVDEVLKLFVR
jgi:NYN domain